MTHNSSLLEMRVLLLASMLWEWSMSLLIMDVYMFSFFDLGGGTLDVSILTFEKGVSML